MKFMRAAAAATASMICFPVKNSSVKNYPPEKLLLLLCALLMRD